MTPGDLSIFTGLLTEFWGLWRSASRTDVGWLAAVDSRALSTRPTGPQMSLEPRVQKPQNSVKSPVTKGLERNEVHGPPWTPSRWSTDRWLQPAKLIRLFFSSPYVLFLLFLSFKHIGPLLLKLRQMSFKVTCNAPALVSKLRKFTKPGIIMGLQT